MDSLNELEKFLGVHLSMLARSELAAGAAHNSFKKGEVIVQEGSSAQHMHLVLSGTIKNTILNTNGNYLVLNLLIKGEAFGLETLAEDQTYRSSSVAMTASSTLSFSSGVIRYLVRENPSVATWTTNLMINAMVRLNQSVLGLRSKPTIARLSNWLLLLDRGMTGKGIHILRNDLAELIGISRETASRHLSELKSLGMIKMKNNLIFIPDHKRLETFSKELKK